MGSGSYILARDINFNREVLENGGIYYNRTIEDLSDQMKWIYKNEKNRYKGTKFSIKKVKNYYNWDRIAKEYEKLFRKIN